MVSIIKWFVRGLVGLLMVIALAVLLVPIFVDPNDYRDEIATLVKQQTGRDLAIEGDLNISVFPWLGIKTQELRLSQPIEIGGDMVRVKTAQLRLKLLPLFSKRFEVDTIVLEQPMLELITLENGISSFRGLAGKSNTGEAIVTNGTDHEAGLGGAAALVIQGVEISRANIVWDDRAAQQKVMLKDFSLITGNLLGEQYVPLKMTGAIVNAVSTDEVRIELSGVGRINTTTSIADLRNLEANLQQGKQNIEVQVANLSFNPDYGVEVGELEIAARVDIPIAQEDHDAVPVRMNLDSEIESLSYTLSSDLSVQNLAIQGQFENRPFTLSIPSVVANIDEQFARINAVTLRSKDVQVNVSNIALRQFIDDIRATGKLQADPFNAALLLKDIGVNYEPQNAQSLQSAALTADFSGGMQGAKLKGIELNLDASTLRGDVTLTDFTKMAIAFNLSLDRLNLDRYLPKTDEREVSSQASEVSGAEALAIPLASLQTINANGVFKADELVLSGLTLDDINVLIISKNGVLTVKPNVKLYDGGLDGDIVFDGASKAPTLHIDNRLDLVSLGGLLTDANITDQLTGIGFLDVDVKVTEQNGVQTNEGTIKLLAKNGALKGVDIKQIIDSAYRAYVSLKGKTPNVASEGEATESDETRFAELLGTFHLKDYQLTNDDFELKAPLFRVSGGGEVNIASQRINYLVKVAVVESTDGQGGKAMDELAGIIIPIRFSGDLSSPSYSLDIKALYQDMLKQKVKKKTGALLNEKLGIKDGDNLSTKDALKAALLNKLDDTEQSPVKIDAVNDDAPSNDNSVSNEKTKKELREERKRKLIESLFD